ncbi:MAG: protein tyrosine phosphatase family protein [Cyanobacteria bacterium P01_F01_bin.143]
MNITNPFKLIFNFIKLFLNRYLGINMMGDKVENIFNYLKLSESIATGGQPTEYQLSLVKNSGYQVVINLALPTSKNALADEKTSVKSLGMKYINIPIDFNNPTVGDFDCFCEVMQKYQPQKIFVHCAANLRVSAFMYLYRTIYQGLNQEVATQDLNKLWQPNETWQKLIQEVQEKRG